MIKITNEDNMLLMARYPDNYFDLAIVDPPYGMVGNVFQMKSKNLLKVLSDGRKKIIYEPNYKLHT